MNETIFFSRKEHLKPSKSHNLSMAQEKIREAIDLISKTVKGTPAEDRAQTYTIPWLKAFINGSYRLGNIEELKKLLDENERD